MFVPARYTLPALLSACAAVVAPGCGEPLPEEAPGRALVAQVELLGAPSASYDAQTGKTTVVVQFVPRAGTGSDGVALPLGPEEVAVSLRVDGRELDSEAVLQAQAQQLETSLAYGLVLDASYSMLQHQPPAFEPMKRAAKASIDRGAAGWRDRQGRFIPLVSWFDEYVYTQEGAWSSEDVLSIPAPGAGTATKLHAAVEAMARRLWALRQQGVAAGARDRHLMLVFSDGADNLSWFDNAQVARELTTSSGARYQQRGAAAVSLEQTLQALRDQPHLTVHVIGLGSKVNAEELGAIAAAGRGKYFSNPLSGELDAVFEKVTREFATQQTVGATIPLPPGEYAFELVVTPKGGGEPALCRLALTAGSQPTIAQTCAQ